MKVMFNSPITDSRVSSLYGQLIPIVGDSSIVMMMTINAITDTWYVNSVEERVANIKASVTRFINSTPTQLITNWCVANNVPTIEYAQTMQSLVMRILGIMVDIITKEFQYKELLGFVRAHGKSITVYSVDDTSGNPFVVLEVV